LAANANAGAMNRLETDWSGHMGIVYLLPGLHRRSTPDYRNERPPEDVMRNLLGIFAFIAFTTCAEAGWNDSQLISAIYAQDGSTDIIIQQANYNGTGCSQASGKYLLLSANHPNYKSIYALLLSAHHSGAPANLFLKTNVCTSAGYSEISLVILGTLN
jgi:hypothetical protein